MSPISIQKYIDLFCGNNLKTPTPGEHHFVAVCLIPLILRQLKTEEDIKKLTYVNPDGEKSRRYPDKFIQDITFGDKGVEIKYSRDNNVTFTSSQIRNSFDPEKFNGVIALMKVKETMPEVWFLSKEGFEKIQMKYRPKVKRKKQYFSCRIDVEIWERWDTHVEEKFLKLLGISL